MAIDSKDLLVQLKAFSRAGSLPLDASEVHDSLEEARNYAKSAKAYAGQTIKALVDGAYVSYVLQPSGDSLELTKVGVDQSEIKVVVRVVDALPESGQEQGVLYINTTDSKGYIYNGTAFVQVFEQVDGLGDKVSQFESDIKGIDDKLDVIQGSAETEGSIKKSLADAKAYADGLKDTLDADIAKKADADKVYTKEQADSAIQQAITDSGHLKRSIVDALPEVADADINTIYMVPKATADGENQHYDEFMLLNGAFEKIGDTKVDLSDYAKTADVEGKIATAKSEAADDATSKADAAKDAAIEAAKADATAKADKALEDAKADATSKADKALEDAKSYSDGLSVNYEKAGAVSAALGEDFPADTTVKSFVDAQKKAAEDTAKSYTDAQIDTVNTNLNTKVTADDVSAAIKSASGEVPEGQTLKEYIDAAVSAGGTDASEAIAKAKQEAVDSSKEYTDSALTITEF